MRRLVFIFPRALVRFRLCRLSFGHFSCVCSSRLLCFSVFSAVIKITVARLLALPGMEDPNATANLPSILPQRWPAVRDLLGELDQCLNHLATGPGPNITDIYPRLHEQFWRAAYAINRHKSQSDSDSSSSHSNNRDVRDWPAFMRERVPDLRLQATLFPIFAPSYNTIKLNPKHAQRINKACQDLGCTVYDLFLDFSTEVANSTHALQAISSLFYRHPEVTRDALVSAVQTEMLSRPSLTPDTPPTPTVSEVTKAIKSKSFVYMALADIV